MSEYELVKKLGSYDNFKGLKSMAKVPRYKLFARNKLSVPTVPSQQYEIAKNGEKTGGFPLFLPYKSPKTPFFA